MEALDHLFQNNKAWAARIQRQDPKFFRKLSNRLTVAGAHETAAAYRGAIAGLP